MKRLGQGPIERDVRVLRVLLGKCGLAQPGGWLPFSAYGQLPGGPISAAGNPFAVTVPRALLVKSWDQRVNCMAPNDGSNYWRIQMAGSVTGTFAEVNTAALSPGVSSVLSVPNVNCQLPSSETHLYLYVFKVGSPGNMYMAAPCVFVV